MGKKLNYIQAVNFVNQFHTRRDKRNSENKTEFRKMRLKFLMMYFDA